MPQETFSNFDDTSHRPMRRFFSPLLRLVILVLLVPFIGYVAYIVGSALLQKSYDLSQETPPYETAAGNSCNIAVIPLVGQLFASQPDAEAQTATDNSDNTSAEYVLQQIEQADADSSIKGILLRVDSPGGSPVAGEMIADALKSLNKPSAAVIWDEGDSAAYLASTGANEIIASPFSDVADIGVTGSYIDQSEKDAQEGLQFIQISAGTYKDTGDPDNPLTPAGKAYLQQNVNIDYQTLINEIAKNRSMSVDAVQQLADGASMDGSAALGTGLIDALGDDATARSWFAKKLNIGANAVLCE